MEDHIRAEVGGIEQIQPALIDDRIPNTCILFDIGLDGSVRGGIGTNIATGRGGLRQGRTSRGQDCPNRGNSYRGNAGCRWKGASGGVDGFEGKRQMSAAVGVLPHRCAQLLVNSPHFHKMCKSMILSGFLCLSLFFYFCINDCR